MKKILVTGAKGQLGSELQGLCLRHPEAVWVFTDVEDIDLTNRERAIYNINTIAPNLIINCAAYTAVDKAETDADRAFAINDFGTETLVLASNDCKAGLVHISTDYVFDGYKDNPYTEEDKVNPQSIYGKSKLAGEQHVINYSRGYVFRTSWLYSAFGNNFVKTILRLARERNEINIVADQHGTPTYAHDLAQALIEIFVEGEAEGNEGIYHFSNMGATTWFGFASEIVRMANLTCKVNPISTDMYPLPAPRPAYSVMDKSKVCSTFGLSIPGWEDSLMTAIKMINR